MTRSFRFHTVFLIAVFVTLAAGLSFGQVSGRWPGWRGDGSGISGEENLPIYWNTTENVAWKTPLPGEGNSSPIVFDGKVYLTASTEEGKTRHVLCVDAASGEIIWNAAFTADRVAETYPKNGYASATPVTDGKRLYVFFDSPGLMALDMHGNMQWTVDLGPFKNSWNQAASPVLCDGKVIVCCDQDKGAFIAAYDCATGKQVWKTERSMPRQFATPLVIEVDGKKQVVQNGQTIISYDAATGKELWRCRGMKPNLTPTAVFAGGLVAASSGRNGPAMLIDPTGRGDITETHVLMHFPAGGPYVPSPIVYPHMMLPGDNGAVRFISKDGKLVASERLRGHFTSSPVAADGKIYWTNERGDTYVLDAVNLPAEAGEEPANITVLSINSIGVRVLASPAIANGSILIRSDKSLFCIRGGKQGQAETVDVAGEKKSLDELKKLYAEHQETEGPDIAVRLKIIADVAKLDDPEAIPFLVQMALKDNHWDVSEEAAKVLGQFGEAALPAMIGLLESGDWRPYLKIISADNVAALKEKPAALQAVPALVKLTKHNRPLVRIACIEALAALTDAHAEEVSDIAPVVIAGLDDAEGVVQKAAIEGVGLLADKLADRRDALVPRLLDLAADKNPIVAKQARETLLNQFEVPKEIVMKDEILYGEQRKDPVVRYLNAGPVSVKFQDGELRYIKVGDKEIVRRIYLGVRDGRWDTVMPDFEKLEIDESENGFKITMSARCVNDIADFSWSGTITGAADGTITFKYSGQAGMEFRSYRVGLCVLYGAESLAGQKYAVVNSNGETVEGVFPELISNSLLQNKFNSLSYTTADGITVSCGLENTLFGMEDQRNFGDSSYKAFSGIDYAYPTVPKGVKGGQKLTLKVAGVEAEDLKQTVGPLKIAVNEPIPGAKIPKLLPSDQSQEGKRISEYNGKQEKYGDAQVIVLSYNPAAHMPDDDTYMENITAIYDQVKTLESFAPQAKIRVDPITIDSWYPRPGPDPRNRGLFGSAWCLRMIKCMALAGVDEAVFKVGPGYAQPVLQFMRGAEGCQLLEVDVPPHAAVDAFAFERQNRRLLCVINKTDSQQMVEVEAQDRAGVLSLNASTSPENIGNLQPKLMQVPDGTLSLTLGPFEQVCVITGQ